MAEDKPKRQQPKMVYKKKGETTDTKQEEGKGEPTVTEETKEK